MRKSYWVCLFLVITAVIFISFKNSDNSDYWETYHQNLAEFKNKQQSLIYQVQKSDLAKPQDIAQIKAGIAQARTAMKAMDFWFRYLHPLTYKRINAPLPVEWETEVFEKFEKPYKREGAGLTLAALYLNEENIVKDSLLNILRPALLAADVYAADSITKNLKDYNHFYLCNRLLLLDLAAIYTTGFECPDAKSIIPELRALLVAVSGINRSFNNSFPETALTSEYCKLFDNMVAFTAAQPDDNEQFDHYTFLRKYVNPLFIINQQLIAKYQVVSHNLVDYSLNKKANSIFDKSLYYGQNDKGIFIRVEDSVALKDIESLGKLLFFDPLLSGNNMRSCASCHKPTEYFTDTALATSLQYDQKAFLPRNSPSLVNSVYNHLVMMDGKHFNLQSQTKAVISNMQEMGCDEAEVVKKVLSCNDYRQVFQRLLKYTPQEKEITYDHIVSAITFYYSKFSNGYSPFDNAMNDHAELTAAEKSGFNLFMSKAQCATCHFVPQFNGVKPPYVSSEFEVLGVPSDTSFTSLGSDEGRYAINPAKETRNAFRTGSLRNSAHTMPYMHNGVFRSMREVIDFYDAGGGAGRGLNVSNQTLSSDSLKLTIKEKDDLSAFINSLNEDITFEAAPTQLPKSKRRELNERKVGGVY